MVAAVLTQYPRGVDIGTAMSPEDYRQLSEEMNDDLVAWSPIFDIYDIFVDQLNLDNNVEQIKSILNKGDRVTFGILLPDAGKGW